jgi:hypothetical protein
VILLLVCLAAAAFMAGLSWFVGVVHYPLFTGVGSPSWSAYHRRHSDRTTLVVVVPMLVELVAATALAVDPPTGVSAGAAGGGMALAVATWTITARASLLHRRLGDPLDPDAHRSLLAAHHVRTALWSLHAVLTAAMVTQAAPSS